MIQEGISDETIQIGKQWLSLSIAIGQAFMVMEMICYVLLFQSLKDQNQSFYKIVQESILKKRAKKNTITFLGQAIIFVLELIYSVLMHIMINFGGFDGLFEPAAIPCAQLVLMAGSTATQIMTSPELRRFYLGYD